MKKAFIMDFRYLFILSVFAFCTSINAQSEFSHPEKENDVERVGFVGNIKSVTQYSVKWVKDQPQKGQVINTWKFNKEKQLTEYTCSWKKRIMRYDQNGDCIEDTHIDSDSVIYEQTLRKFEGKNLMTEEQVFTKGKLSMEKKNSYDQKNRLISSNWYNHAQDIPYSELKITYDKKGNLLDSVYASYSYSENKCVPYSVIHNTYNKDGKIAERVEQNWNGESRFAYEYNSSGKLCGMKHYQQGEGLVEQYLYDDLGREVCTYVMRMDRKDSVEYDQAGRIVKFMIYSISKPNAISKECTYTYNAEGNLLESFTREKDGTWEKRVWEYKNGKETSATIYYGRGDKYRKKKENTSADEDEIIVSPYEYVDEPWAHSKSIYEYDQWGNKTTYTTCDAYGDCHLAMAASYEGYNRPTKSEVYHDGKVFRTTLSKTDSHTNTTEILTYEKGEFKNGFIYEFEYYDK